MLKANIKEADLILVTSDPTRTEATADMYTILFIVAIKGIAPNVYCIAEILKTDQIINAKRAGADEVIQSNKLISSVMEHSLFSRGVSTGLLELVDSNHGARIKLVREESFIGHTFASASQLYLAEEKILIGVKRDNKMMIVPPQDMLLQTDDKYLILCKDE